MPRQSDAAFVSSCSALRCAQSGDVAHAERNARRLDGCRRHALVRGRQNVEGVSSPLIGSSQSPSSVHWTLTRCGTFLDDLETFITSEGIVEEVSEEDSEVGKQGGDAIRFRSEGRTGPSVIWRGPTVLQKLSAV